MSEQHEPESSPPGSGWVWVWLVALTINLLIAPGIAILVRGRGHPTADLQKGLWLFCAAFPLDLLLAVGVGLWLARTRGWRSDNPTTTATLAIFLFILGTAAAVILVFFGCLGAVQN
jgi:hypothetical protein